ncbi:polysaccharide deacetylase family protein [Pilimelia columellifera]|uniref:NodB homology domain-containing protein n=1 Tax=Pilimelia columellifera subsp. columellifera TaxID=706583 RepID=A0ABN3NK36_9ACTN
MRERLRLLAGGATRLVTGALAVATLGAAVLAWVELSRPFDPEQIAARIAATPALDRVPAAVQGAVTVLTYHGVSDRPTESSAVSRQTFAEHLAALRAAGYETVRLDDIDAMLSGERVDLPDRALLLTFDGGSLTDWTTVDPMLATYGYSAVAFVPTGRIVQPGTPSTYLSTRQLGRLRDTGRWEFGSRSHALDTMAPVPGNIRPALTHRLVDDGGWETIEQWRARVRADLDRSQQQLRSGVGGPATAFAYPFGDWGLTANDPKIRAELSDLLAEAGFRFAFVGEGVPTGHVDALTDHSPQWRLPRIGVRTTTSAERLMEMIYRAQPILPPAQLTALSWSPPPGEAVRCVSTAAGVTVRAAGYSLCEDRDINTTRWTNYDLATTVSGVDRRCTAIVAVRTGTGTGHYGRVEIALGNANVAIRQQILSQPRVTLASGAVKPGARRSLDIVVHNRTVIVTVPGARPVRATIDRRLAIGGVALGLETARDCSVGFASPRMVAYR